MKSNLQSGSSPAAAVERAEGVPAETMVRERRLTMLLMGCWQELRGDAMLPCASAFDRAVIEDVWPHCFTLIPIAGATSLRFERIGKGLRAISGLAGDEPKLAKVPPNTLLGIALRALPDVVATRRVVLDGGNFVDRKGRTCLYRSILLPFSDGAEGIGLVLGGARSKVAAE